MIRSSRTELVCRSTIADSIDCCWFWIRPAALDIKLSPIISASRVPTRLRSPPLPVARTAAIRSRVMTSCAPVVTAVTICGARLARNRPGAASQTRRNDEPSTRGTRRSWRRSGGASTRSPRPQKIKKSADRELRGRGSRLALWRGRNSFAAHVDKGAFRRLNYADHDRRTGGAPQHDARCVDEREKTSHVVDLAAARALGQDGRHVVSIDLGECPRHGVAVEDEIVVHRFGHAPLGPKRSVRMRSAGSPTRSSPSAATSTSAVGPQMKARAFRPRGALTSSSMASSILRAYPFHPAGWLRVSVYETARPFFPASISSS